MKQKTRGRHLVLLLFIGAMFLLTGCTGGLPAASWFGIVAGEDAVFLAANTQVLALDLERGSQLWAFPLEPDAEIGPFYAPPTITEDRLIVGSYSDQGIVYALARENGSQAWMVGTEAPILAQPAAVDSGFIVANDDGTVYLIESEAQNRRALFDANEAIWAAPLVDGAAGRAYVSSLDHHLYALEITSGELLWSFDAGAAVIGKPALSDGVLYVGALNDRFFAIDADTGDELWRFETEGWVWGGPRVDDGTVFFGDLSGDLYALDAADGSERWFFSAGAGVRASPVLSQDGEEGKLLFFGTREGNVYALDAEDGTQEWVQSLNGPIYSEPVVQGNVLLVSPFNAQASLVALAPESGAVRWSYPPQEE